ncbi:MAG: molybdopterin-dependent oxidoreductase [Candidatus Aenigmarchaeota archaeon]|nr:molybdopterin-dependent oxidoreductase [Candidatus Aenigmarchaeota archaeon]
MKTLFFLVIFASIIICGCIGNEVIELDGVEIREYEGEDLSSINDLRDVSISGPQEIEINDYFLEVFGLVETPKKYTYEEVLENQKYSKVVELQCVMGWDAKVLWEGILVKDLLYDAIPSSEANTVIFHASDGYTTSFPLDYITENDILMAYKVNNVTLTDSAGFPFTLVAEQKWGYKWIKWITKIELSDNSEYEGYWESRGYSNSGDLEDSYYD